MLTALVLAHMSEPMWLLLSCLCRHMRVPLIWWAAQQLGGGGDMPMLAEARLANLDILEGEDGTGDSLSKNASFRSERKSRIWFFCFGFLLLFLEIGTFKCTSKSSWNSISLLPGSVEQDRRGPVLQLGHEVVQRPASGPLRHFLPMSPGSGSLTCPSPVPLSGSCPSVPMRWALVTVLSRGGLMTLSSPVLLGCLKGQARCPPVGKPASGADFPEPLARALDHSSISGRITVSGS